MTTKLNALKAQINSIIEQLKIRITTQTPQPQRILVTQKSQHPFLRN